jgi:hypothetical protein
MTGSAVRLLPYRKKATPISMRHSIKADIRFTEKQLARARQGLLPLDMEDRWVAYCENDRLCFNRSWTGDQIYEARIHKREDFYEISAIIVEHDPKRWNEQGDDENYRQFCFLFADNLLGIHTEFPFCSKSKAGDLKDFRKVRGGLQSTQPIPIFSWDATEEQRAALVANAKEFLEMRKRSLAESGASQKESLTD